MRVLIAAIPWLWTGSAAASCHVIDIVEIFGGTSSDPNAHYVVLDASGGQTIVGGSTVTTTMGTFGTFAGDVANGAAGDRILMATAQAETLFSVTADQTAPGLILLDLPTGQVAYSCSGDTVMYGAGSIPDLVEGCALKKSGATWSLGDPTPMNNNDVTGSLPGSCVLPDAGVPEPQPDLGMDSGPADAGPADAEPADMATAPDAAVSIDAAPADMALPPDAAGGERGPIDGPADTSDDEREEDSGCSCRLSSAQTGDGWSFLLVATLLALKRRGRLGSS